MRNNSEQVMLRKNSKGVLHDENNDAGSVSSGSDKRQSHFRRRSEQPVRNTALTGQFIKKSNLLSIQSVFYYPMLKFDRLQDLKSNDDK